MSSRYNRLACGLLLVFVLSACGGSEPQQAKPTPSAQIEPTAMPEVANSAPAMGNQSNELLDQLVDPQKTAEKLKTLQSYRLRTITKISTKNAESSNESISETLEERINQPLAVHLEVKTNTPDPTTSTWLIDGSVYQVQDTGTEQICNATVLNDQMMEQTFDMARSFNGGMLNALAASFEPTLVAEAESINGMTAAHYQVESDAAGMLIKGDFWITPEGILIKSSSSMDISSEGNSMITETTIELDQIDQIAPFAVPASCTQVADTLIGGLPKLDDAQNLMMDKSLMSYSTSMSIADVITFYKTELASQGYTVSSIYETAEGTMLQAVNDSHTFNLTIGAAMDGLTGVLIQMQ